MMQQIIETDKFLSIIVPAYKQEKTIKKDLENIIDTLKLGIKNYDFEILDFFETTSSSGEIIMNYICKK